MRGDDEELDLSADQASPTTTMSTEERLVRARSRGLVLPMVMIRRRLGKQKRLFEHGQAILVVILARNANWVSCIASAVRVSAEFDRVSEVESSERARMLQEKDYLMTMARGRRQAFVAAGRQDVPDSLMSAADIVLEIGHPTPEELAEAVRCTTLGAVRGLASVSTELDLLDAIAAIRHNSRTASAVSRLLALRPRGLPPNGTDVPRVEELHGFGAAAEWALRLLEDLALWRKGAIDFAAIDRHIVLASAPGLGKTTFARAVAKSAQLPIRVSSMGTLFSTSSGHLDGVIKAVDALFAPDPSGGPFIVLLDELEGIPDRATLQGKDAAWWTPLVAHFLTRLDGATSRDDLLIVLGATNHPERLDSALVRPGRLNRVICIGPPSEEDIVGIMRQHLRNDLPDLDLEPIAALIAGASGAQIAGWIKAARSSARRLGRAVSEDDLLREISPPADHPAALLERISVHESGHAVAAYALDVGRIRAIAISGGPSLGHVSVEVVNRPLPLRRDLHREVLMSLAGRAAEEVILGDVSGGAGGAIDSDLAHATHLVERMHLTLGLGASIAYRGVEARARPDVGNRIDLELERLYAETIDFVRTNVEPIRRLAQALMEEKLVTGERFLELMAAYDFTRSSEGPDA